MTTPALAPSPSPSPTASPSPTPTKLRFGILGAARIAPKALVAPVRQSERACLTAVAARDRERARHFAQEHGIPGCDGSYEALLRREDVNAVYIALPASLHAPWTLAALEANKHVLCEKPFAGNAGDATRMVAAAGEHNRVLMEAMHYRFHPLAERIRAILASGEIGQVIHVDAVFDAPIRDTSDIRHTFALGGGAMMDLAVTPSTGPDSRLARSQR